MKGYGSSVGVSSGGHGGSVVVGSSNGGSVSYGSDSGLSNGHGGSGGISDSGLVYADGVLINDGGLDDVLDRVDLVGLGDSVGLGNLNGVGFGNMFVDDDLTLNGDGDSDGDLDGVFVYLKLGLDAGHLGSDSGVSTHGSGDSLDGDGISGGGSLVGRCGRDGSIGCRGSGESRGSNGDSDLRGLGLTGNISVGSSLGHRLLLAVSKAGLDGLGTNLDLTVSDNFVVSLSDSGASMDMFLHTVSYNGRGSMHSMGQGGGVQKRLVGSVVAGGSMAKSHQH